MQQSTRGEEAAAEQQSGVSESAAGLPAASAASLPALDAVGGTSLSIAVSHSHSLYASLLIHVSIDYYMHVTF